MSDEIDNPIDEPVEQKAFVDGAIEGFKRIDLRKVPDDYSEQALSYLLGYVVGWLVSVALVVFGVGQGLDFGFVPQFI